MTAGIVVEMLASNPRIIPDRKGSEDKPTNRGLRLSEKDGERGKEETKRK